MNTTPPMTAPDVVHSDLENLAAGLADDFPRLAGKRLLVTGGAGFLGYYLVQAVLHWNRHHNDGDPVELVVYDNFMRGLPDWLTALDDDPALTLVEHDIVEPPPAEIGDVDFLIHAASIASPIFYREFPIETMDANVIGLRHLLEYAKAQADKGKPLESFLFYSTSEIYGDPDPAHIPTPETYRGNVSCTGARACYDESKRYGETLCVNFAQQYGLPIVTVRPFNNYGPGLHINDGRVLPDFARNIFAGEDIVLLSDGSMTRTFCYISDSIEGYFRILFRGRPGEAYNIGTESPEISILTLAQAVAEVGARNHGWTGAVTHGVSDDPDYLTDNPNRRCPVIAKARDELGYEPKVGFEEGIERALAWYSGNR